MKILLLMILCFQNRNKDGKDAAEEKVFPLNKLPPEIRVLIYKKMSLNGLSSLLINQEILGEFEIA